VRLTNIGEDCASIIDKNARDKAAGSSIYRVLVPQIVSSIGLTTQKIIERQEPVIFDHPVHCSTLERTIEPGICVGMRSIIEVITKENVSAIAEIELRLCKEGEGEWMSWAVDGEPPAEMRIQGLDTGHATASSAVNRILDVIAAPPGVVTVDQMESMKFIYQQGDLNLMG
jgi:4-hydroxy-tetrahydrodipicolinate reductase